MKTTKAQARKLEKLKLVYEDKYSIAQTMRQNLASDIQCGYGLANVTRQMVAIEQYENTVVKAAKKELEEYKEYLKSFDPALRERRVREASRPYVAEYFRWDSDDI